MSAVSERAAIVAIVAGQISSGRLGENLSASELVDRADDILTEAAERHPVEDD